MEGHLGRAGVQVEVGDHPEEGAGEAEAASFRREEAGEAGTDRQKLAQAEVAEGRRGDPAGGGDLQEQPPPVSEKRE